MLEGQQGLLRHPALAAFACAGLALAVLVVPLPAEAHGLVQRANLPIPEWLFGWAAAIVLLVSFVALAVLWPEPRLEHDRWRPLPDPLGRALGSRALEIACGAVGVVLLAVVIVAGLAGTQSPLNNFAPTFVFIIFWVGLAFASALFGDVFAAFSPWRALGRACGSSSPARAAAGRRRAALPGAPRALARRRGAAGLHLDRARLRVGRAAAHARHRGARLHAPDPRRPGASTAVEAWTRRGEAFAVYFGLFARISPFERRDGTVGVRPPLAGLPHARPVPGTVAFVVVMIGTRHLRRPEPGTALERPHRRRGDRRPARWSRRSGSRSASALVGGFYALGIAGARSVGGDLSAAAAAARLRPLAGADRDRLRGRPLPHLPDLRGPVDRLPRLRPARRGLGPVRHRHGRRSTTAC